MAQTPMQVRDGECTVCEGRLLPVGEHKQLYWSHNPSNCIEMLESELLKARELVIDQAVELVETKGQLDEAREQVRVLKIALTSIDGLDINDGALHRLVTEALVLTESEGGAE